MINIYDFITDNLLDKITSSSEQVALLYLVRKSKEKGEIAPNVQVQKTHIARICHYSTSDRSNMTKFANHIEEQLKEHGYISTTYESWLNLPNGKKVRTTTWVFTDNFHENLQNANAKCKLRKSAKKTKTIPSTKAATPMKAVANEVEKKATLVATQNNPLVQVYNDF